MLLSAGRKVQGGPSFPGVFKTQHAPMRRFRLTATQWLPRTLDEVFPFFADPGNLQTITPAWLHFRLETRGDIEMKTGLRLHHRIRLWGIPVLWVSEITAWEPPHRFVDEQRRGPYRLWIHEHTFEPEGDGTRVNDLVTYAVPGGVIVQRMAVARDLEKIFAFRRRKLEEIF